MKEYVGAGCRAGEEMAIILPGGEKMEFCWCPAGNFMMGSPETEEGRCNDEKQHLETLTIGFWMGKYEVTQAQWKSVMKQKSPSEFKGSNRPVEKVSWDDCIGFIRKVNAAGAGNIIVSLPTEAQWEYACRAGTTTPFSFGSTLNGDKANFNDDFPYGTTTKGRHGGYGTTPVGSYAPNAWGLYDMHGNVREWCRDECVVVSEADPTGAMSDFFCIVRGGGWFSPGSWCRSAYRHCYLPSEEYNDLGFRLCCYIVAASQV